MEAFFELASVLLYGLAALWGLGGLYRPSAFRGPIGHGFMASGFVFLTAWITVEGTAIHGADSRSQFLLLFVWSATVIYAAIQFRFHVPRMLGHVAAVACLVLAGTLATSRSGTMSPELTGALVRTHIWTIVASYAGFTLTFITSIMFLVQHRRLLGHRPLLMEQGDYPSLEILERVGYTSLAWAFPLLSISLLLGVIGQAVNPMLGELWYRDPKVVGGLLVWIIYGALLNGRLASLLRGYRFARASAWAFSGLIFIYASTTWICGTGAHVGDFLPGGTP